MTSVLAPVSVEVMTRPVAEMLARMPLMGSTLSPCLPPERRVPSSVTMDSPAMAFSGAGVGVGTMAATGESSPVNAKSAPPIVTPTITRTRSMRLNAFVDICGYLAGGDD
jgi:hypothetical protein